MYTVRYTSPAAVHALLSPEFVIACVRSTKFVGIQNLPSVRHEKTDACEAYTTKTQKRKLSMDPIDISPTLYLYYIRTNTSTLSRGTLQLSSEFVVEFIPFEKVDRESSSPFVLSHRQRGASQKSVALQLRNELVDALNLRKKVTSESGRLSEPLRPPLTDALYYSMLHGYGDKSRICEWRNTVVLHSL